jgi:signal transduction histidine kinase
MNLLLQAILTISLLASNNSNFDSNSEFIQKISQTLRYPLAARQANIEELVYVSLAIDEFGQLDHFRILQSPNLILEQEVSRSFNLIQKTWKKRYLKDKIPGQEYLVILEFTLDHNNVLERSLFDQAKKELENENNEEALYLLNQCIDLNPYSEDYFEKRSELQRSMGNLEASQLDFLRARKLKNELITYMIITGYTL